MRLKADPLHCADMTARHGRRTSVVVLRAGAGINS